MSIKNWVLFIDRIETSSYPVTETGYAMLYRAWLRARDVNATIHIVYPDTVLSTEGGRISVAAHRLYGFEAIPYEHFRSQRHRYVASSDVGSRPCHTEGRPVRIELEDVDVVVFRQETGRQRIALLEALRELETKTSVYLSPRLALSSSLSSKVLPVLIAPDRVPRSWSTAASQGDRATKVEEALEFLSQDLGSPETAMVKPAARDNGVGITVLGRWPLNGQPAGEPRQVLTEMVDVYGDCIVQEYIPSVRIPHDLDIELSQVRLDRRDFGEVRFILIDGEVPRNATGEPILFARRVPSDESLLADSGISYPTSLSGEEMRFLRQVGDAYRRWGIRFGGGDIIRTPDPSRPFLFTDAAQFVCGHAVVTGALNGEPYLIVDRVLDSVERQVAEFKASQRSSGLSASPPRAFT